MSLLNVANFLGRRPAIADGILEDNHSTTCLNCRIEGGEIKPLKTSLQVQAKTTAGTLASIYYYRPSDIWLEWENDVDCVSAQIGADAYDRVIYTGDGAPKMTYNSIITAGGTPYPGSSFLLGVPPPGYVSPGTLEGIAPSLVVTGTPTDPDDLVDTRFYVVTCVDGVGAEGLPSPVGGSVEVAPGQGVDVTIPAIPTGNYDIDSYRVYRTSTGSTSTEFQYVGGGTNFGGTYADAIDPEDLGEVLPSEIYDLPSSSMIGITALAGGYMAGHFDNVLAFSVPAAPHAWPVQYQLNTKTDIVGIAPLDDNTLMVVTKDRPYIASGVDPSSMVLTELPLMQAGVSKDSIADIGTGVVYASPDGLVYTTKGGTSLITQGIFTREQWQALTPSGMKGYMWEGMYICFHSGNTGFIVNPNAPQAGIVDLDDYYTGAFHDPLDDALYVIDGANIKQFDAGATYRNFTWKSKVIEPAHPSGLGVCLLLGDSTDKFDVSVYADGELRETHTRTEGTPFRFSGGYRARKFQLEVSSRSDGTGGALHIMRAGTTMKDLRP